MALAKKCDICGKYYEVSGDNYNKSANAIQIRSRNLTNTQYWELDTYDCCPQCINSIVNLIDNLKNPEGPVKLGDLLGNTEDDLK